MNPAHIILVKALNELVSKYNEKTEGVNYVDVRNFEQYIISQGVDITACNIELNK